MGSLVVRHQGKVFVVRRPSGGLWGGLWEFPTFDVAGNRNALEQVRSRLRESFGLSLTSPKVLGRFSHPLSHREIHLTAWKARGVSAGHAHGGRWVTAQALAKLPEDRFESAAVFRTALAGCLGRGAESGTVCASCRTVVPRGSVFCPFP
jgi:adenine-specific DNA glycosylase